MKDRKTLQRRVQKAIEVRETGDLKSSAKLFSELLPDIEILIHSEDPEDNKTYIGIGGQLVIQKRLEAKDLTRQALALGRELYDYAKARNLPDPNAVRGVSNTLVDLGQFEEARVYLDEMIGLIPSTQTSRQGEMMSHLALCWLRLGNKRKAEITNVQAIYLIEENKEKVDEMNQAVRKSYSLMVKALIMNAKDQKERALSLAREAYTLARKFKLAHRTVQAGEIVRFLSRE